MGFWQLLQPTATTNLITNPSFETNTNGWTTTGTATMLRYANQAQFGGYGLQVSTNANNDGVYYSTVALTSGTTYTFSVYLTGTTGNIAKIFFADMLGVGILGTPTTATVSGLSWIRIVCTYTETSSTTRRLYVVLSSGAGGSAFNIDGAQCEAQSTATTYCDGDQDGCLWSGLSHASTSTRSSSAAAGGAWVDLNSNSAYVEEQLGIGMPPVKNVATPYGLVPGALYQRSVAQPRVITLQAFIGGGSLAALHKNRSAIINVIKPDVTPSQQTHVLRYTGTNNTNMLINAVYDAGLDFGKMDGFNERVALRFIAYDPYWYSEADTNFTCTGQASLANANRIVQRASSGAWSALGSGAASGVVFSVAYGLDGKLYAAGSFTTMGGVSNATGIAYWDGNAWNAMGTGLSGGNGLCLAVDASGNVYVGGSFTSAGGVANTAGIALWNGSAWSALGTGLAGQAAALVFDSTQNLYAGGSFSAAGGVANTANIARWNGSVWSTVNFAAPNNNIESLTIGGVYLYVGGLFTAIGGISANYIAAFNLISGAWIPLGAATLFNGDVTALAVGPDGTLYAGGNFTGASPANHAARWNGVAWSAMGSGVNNAIYSFAVAPNGSVYAGGNFTTANGITLAGQGLALWNGSAWVPVDVALPGAAIVEAVALWRDGTLSAGFSTGGAASVPVGNAYTGILAGGSATAYPKIRITGPSSGSARIYSMVNYTTGAAVYFNLTIQAGEVITMDFTPGRRSFRSTFQGNVASSILPGSQVASFAIVPTSGQFNAINLFASSSQVTFIGYWRQRYWSVDGGA